MLKTSRGQHHCWCLPRVSRSPGLQLEGCTASPLGPMPHFILVNPKCHGFAAFAPKIALCRIIKQTSCRTHWTHILMNLPSSNHPFLFHGLTKRKKKQENMGKNGQGLYFTESCFMAAIRAVSSSLRSACLSVHLVDVMQTCMEMWT